MNDAPVVNGLAYVNEEETVLLTPIKAPVAVATGPSADFNRGCLLMKMIATGASEDVLDAVAAALKGRIDLIGRLNTDDQIKQAIASYVPYNADLDGPSAAQRAMNIPARAAVMMALTAVAGLGYAMIKENAAALREQGQFDEVFRGAYSRGLLNLTAALNAAVEYGMPNVDVVGPAGEPPVRTLARQCNDRVILALPA